jgi:hypothetical protein
MRTRRLTLAGPPAVDDGTAIRCIGGRSLRWSTRTAVRKGMNGHRYLRDVPMSILDAPTMSPAARTGLEIVKEVRLVADEHAVTLVCTSLPRGTRGLS